MARCVILFSISPKSFRSGFAGIIVLLIILAAISGVGYLILKNRVESDAPVPSPTSLADPTANWKIYVNKSLGFEVMYPPLVQIDKELNDQYNRLTIFKGDGLNFEVRLREKPKEISLDNYYYMDSPIARKIALLNGSVNVYEMPNGYCDGPECSKPFTAVVTQNDSNLYHISFFGDAELSDIENRILSTFRFTR